MSQDQVIVIAFKVVLVAGLAAVALWVAVYSYLAQWRKNPIGKTVVDFAILVAGALLPSTLSLFWHFNRNTSRAAAWIDIVLFGRIAWVMFARIPLWVKLHTGKDGERSYEGMPAFLAEVIRRRGRPRWMDQADGGTPPPGAPAGASSPARKSRSR